MTTPQLLVFATLFGALVLFVWGKWRYDVVGMLALLTLTLTGVVKGNDAFKGFSEPAVITVAAVLVISQALQKTGLVNVLVRGLGRVGTNMNMQVLAMSGAVALLSSIMNNVGALAIMLPVAITLANRAGRSASTLLMPLAFASLLGGMTTLIGTPPNLIISNLRRDLLGESYNMFSFTPVGLAVALAGVLYLAFLGWRLLPQRVSGENRADLYRMADYMTEVRLPAGSPLAGQRVMDLGKVEGVQVVSLVRGESQRPFPTPFTVLQPDDVLIVEATAAKLAELVEDGQLTLVGNETITPEQLASDDVTLAEVVVTALSPIVGQSAVSLRLRQRFNINLIAVSRQGQRLRERLINARFNAGDVLLVHGPRSSIDEALATLGCLPLRDRPLDIAQSGQGGKMALTAGIFLVAILAATLNLLPVAVSFTAAATLMLLLRLINLRDVYESIEWPILVLLATLIPVGAALSSTGGANLIAETILGLTDGWPTMAVLVVVMILTMNLSDIINNAAAALITAPIAIKIAQGLDANPDAFLMAVAVAASSAFLTPIGHQSNTLVMGPGGYKFSDYWKVGLPMEIIVVAVGAPMIALVWGLK
ncbi:SLC13 family permease [Deinococcus arenicola]|uniref:SLC13 family permease n=1 Tax=Deinococcus arenicola TaxID=2994950 RepID=A0ABU4DMB6_9DEIO|nr:SLC13 family permease [Deinococcus sp. ZS9-10]MDV6373583.1 SLC13 family permease [Deinococcus sp. ZS9-10]